MGFETETKPPSLRGRAAAKWYKDRNLTPPGKQDKSPRRTGTRTPRVTKGKVQTQIFGGTMVLQGIILMVPQMREYAEDALTVEEVFALSDALADEVMASAQLRKLFSQLEKIGPHGKFAMVCGAIAFPRLAKYGVLPRELEPAIRQFAANAISVASGPAHDADRGHGLGEIDPGVDSAQNPFAYSDLPQQGGQGEVPNGHHHTEHESDDESEVPPNRVAAAADAD